ncbi:MAG: sensor histidine kinase [Flammeovirgaceae bacterium]|nr:sensor histidine kinase [Flammeovirgaceae bacterium]
MKAAIFNSLYSCDSKEIFVGAINATQTQAEQNKLNLKLIDPGVVSLKFRLTMKNAWVLTNLISNAIHYSYENSTIYLVIRFRNQSALSQFVVKIQGIAPNIKIKFDRYFRIPGTKKEGTGLGPCD